MKLATIASIGIALLAATAPAEDWPCWRGPTGDGISAEKDWSPAAVAAGKVLWRTNVGKGHSSFAVAGGKVYTMGNTSNRDSVFCFDAASGEKIWEFGYACRAGGYPGPRSTPTVDGGFVYAVSRDGDVVCVDAATGKKTWATKVKSDIPKWGISTSPIVRGDLVVLNAGTSGIALRKSSGKRAWSGGAGMPGYASPVYLELGGSDGWLVFSARALFGVGKTGRPRWSFPWETRYDVNAADPVLVGRSQVFISSGYGKGCALLKVRGSGVREAWRNTNMRSHMASPVHHDGFLYGFDDKNLACLDAKTGAVRWSQSGFGKGALMLAAGKLIFVSERGIQLVTAEATPKAYTEIARTQVLGGHTWTPPVLANGRIYCRNQAGDIACVDAKGT